LVDQTRVGTLAHHGVGTGVVGTVALTVEGVRRLTREHDIEVVGAPGWAPNRATSQLQSGPAGGPP